MTRTSPNLATLMAVSGLSVMSLNMFLPALPQIARDLDVSYAAATATVSGYLALTAVLQLILGPLSDRIGRRPVVLFAMGAFAVLSAVCALAQDFTTFLSARLLQGVVIAGSTMALAALRDTSDPTQAAKRISWVAMGMALGPMVGPVAGGILDTALGWRSIFWAMSAGGALCFLLCLLDFKETNLHRSRNFAEQARGYPALLSSGVFWAFSMSIVTGVGCFYIFVSGAPLVADREFGMSTAQLGFAIGVITLGFILGNYVSGRIAEQVGLGGMVLAGRATQVVAIGGNMGLLVMGVLEPPVFFGFMALVGFGNGLSNPSAHAGLMSVDPKLVGSAAGLSGAMVLAAGAVFTALSGAVLETGPPALTLLIAMGIVALGGLASGIAAYRLSRTYARV